ncbi:unnamed protein product [Ranitomeya imitator]|uniref:Ubiquitin carboxyl-terminal hydrolase 38-like N-terminal domain-containing protein n=1 Tax=Ranitomeya imitator TaxID=111125 RepID=A0ABN9M9J6_9NEOB|nr:unnamed protein product [Ranitomeya imitator]
MAAAERVSPALRWIPGDASLRFCVKMDKILEGLVTSSHPLNLKKVIVKKVVESAENSINEEQCKAMFTLTTRLVLEGEDCFQKQVGHQVLEAYARYHRAEFENFFNRNFVLTLLQEGYGSLDRKDVGIIDYIHSGLKLIMSCPSVLDIFAVLQVEVLRIVCERPEPLLCARLSELLSDFVQCVPKGKMSISFCQQLVRTIGHFQCISTLEKELREYVSQVTKVSSLLQNIWKAEPCTLLPSLQEVFAIISSTDASFEPSVALASLVQHIPLQMITVLIRSLTTDPNVKDASMTQALCRMIDWLSWPLAQHVETWVIALLKGLAAVQKFTILIDVTLLKIELGEKSTPKTTTKKKCAICNTKLPPSWEKKLCKTCTDKIVRAEQPSLLEEIRSLVKQEVQSSLAAFTPPPPQPPSPAKKEKSRRRILNLNQTSPMSHPRVDGRNLRPL